MKEKISKIIEENLKRSINILIESFVIYYGEEYRDINKQNISETEFIFYISDDLIKLKSLKNDKDILSENFFNLYNLYVGLTYEVKKEKRNKRKSVLPNIIYTTGKTQDFTEMEMMELKEYINNTYTCQNFVLVNGQPKRKVYIPLFINTDRTVIHELIHSIMRNIIGVLKDEYIPVNKAGIDIIGMARNEVILDEIFTDIEENKIYEIFKNLGGNIIQDFSFFKNSSSIYDEIRYAIYEFYESFKNEIIRSRITLNKNYLINTLGKINYNYFNALINKAYDYLSYGFSRNFRPLINNEVKPTIEIMKKHRESLEEENFEKYYKYLESLGYKIKTLKRSI